MFDGILVSFGIFKKKKSYKIIKLNLYAAVDIYQGFNEELLEQILRCPQERSLIYGNRCCFSI